MSRRSAHSSRRASLRFPTPAKARVRRPFFESLEDRTLLDTGGLPAAIVLGRTLATPSTADTATPSPSYYIGEVQNNQVTITYTVYNEAADTESGVLLTTTLEPGVTVVSSSVTLDGTTTVQPPDQSGQNLAWSLAPIQGDDRESVALTVNLPAIPSNQTAPFQIDSGASAYAMLDAGAVSASTPAATLAPGIVSDPSLLASTVDADTNDPFIQEEAAALDYDPTQIFDFLHTQIGYNSYLGSVRGARGTLWSNAGNALDVASLGVALMRASGIPAQYVSGTLSQSDAQELILSMFPAQYQTVGYIPAGTQTSDPANDPQLLSETESHYWFQFDTGNGMVDADPLMPGATIGETFTTANSTFTAVSADLEETTNVQLVAEIYSTADAAFGLNALQDTTVLNQTFDDAELVGRPLTVGNWVSVSDAGGLFITSTTNTYTPYIELGDEVFPDPDGDTVMQGQPYQEILTNFPFASQILTGLFLNISLSGPDGPTETYQRTLVDRIGYAARQGLTEPANLTVEPDQPPIISPSDLYTVSVLSGIQSAAPIKPLSAQLQLEEDALSQLSASQLSAGNPPADMLVSDTYTTFEEGEIAEFLVDSARQAADYAAVDSVVAYFGQPRITIYSDQYDSSTHGIDLAIDLRSGTMDVIPSPGQNNQAIQAFNLDQGLSDNILESEFVPANTGSKDIGTASIFQQAAAQGIPLVAITASNLNALSNLNISSNAKAYITTAISDGLVVVVPSQEVAVGNTTSVSWYEIDPTNGETVGVLENGIHSALVLEAGTEYYGAIVADETFVDSDLLFFGLKPVPPPALPPLPALSPELAQLLALVQRLAAQSGLTLAQALVKVLLYAEPPLMNVFWSLPTLLPLNQGVTTSSAVSSAATGPVRAGVQSTALSLSGPIGVSWSSGSSSGFTANTLSAADVSILNSQGRSIGSGAATLSASSAIAAIAGPASYNVKGVGDVSFYGSAESNLGVSGNWTNYTATVTGNVSISLTVPAGVLNLNGTALPAGTYTITTNSATLSGSGTMSAPNFGGTASISTTSGTMNLGPGSGTLSVGGKPLNPDDETTLDGYTGTITVSANGDGTDSVSLSGNAGNVLQVTTSPATLTTNQNTPITFAANVQTSLADTYNLTANAPTGWTVTINSSGDVTATPAPGLQSGTYSIQIIAQSQIDPNLETQTTVEVTTMPTQPGINFAVAADPLFTVPFNGAQLPTGFRASIQNLGPAADTYDLTFSNVPTGFTLLNSGTSVTVPGGETGIRGLYLEPNSGQPIPPPGTQLSFTVTATSTINSSITQTQTETFTIPAIDAVTVTANPTAVNTIPGSSIADALTLTNVGNVPENNITLADTLPSGLTLTGLAPVSLAVGQSATETITLTPAASTPLNSMFDATITATFGPTASPVTQTVDIPLQVVVPGAAAIASASVAAGQLGNTNLASQLNDLSLALTNLVESPTSAVYQGEAQASLVAVVGLVGADPYLSALIPALNSDAATLAQADTASAVQSAVSSLGNDLDTLGATLSDEAAYGFSLTILNNNQVGQPRTPTAYGIVIQNNGTQTATYDLSVSGVPNGVTASLSQTSVTQAPGQATSVSGSATDLTETVTSNSTTELDAFTFNVQVTVEGASEITRTATASFAARPTFVQVVSVTPTPAFTDPGGQVDVAAEILNAVNEQQPVEVSYTVSDSAGDVLYTSTPVPTTLNVLTTLTSVDLGNMDTTGFALGEDTITVNVTDASGNPIPGAAGQGTLLIGSPVTATLSTSPSTLPPGSGTTSESLQINSQISTPANLSLLGQTLISGGAQSVAVYGNYAYVGVPGAIQIVDVSDPASPTVVSTFGSGTIPGGSSVQVDVSGDELIVRAEPAYIAPPASVLLIYSLADPLDPTLLGQTPLTYNSNAYSALQYLTVSNDQVFLSSWFFYYSIFSNLIGSQYGDVLDVDISNPAAPAVSSVLYNLPPDPSSGHPDGTSNMFQEAAVNDQTLLVGSTTATGSTVTGTGLVMAFDTSDPTSPTLVSSLQIPGMTLVIGIATYGNEALVIGSSGGWNSGGSPVVSLTGNVVLATLDLTNPQDPTIISTQTLAISAFGLGGLTSLGNGQFITGSLAGTNGAPEFLIFSAGDPNDVLVSQMSVPAIPDWGVPSGNEFYTTSSSGLLIYNIGPGQPIPGTAEITVPTNNGVSIVPGSFSLAPSQITDNGNSETLEWNLSFTGAGAGQTITWQEAVTGLQPGQSLPVAQGASIQFSTQGTTATLTLPDQFVTGEQIIGLSPPTQTVAPAAPATYDAMLLNPTSSEVTYDLSVQGVPASWVSLPASVTVVANGSMDVPLVLTSDSFAALGDFGFTITANGDNGSTASVEGDLVLQGQPVAPDPNSHGIVATLNPTQATAGQGTSAQYVVQLTNTGSADDTFSLAATGLPSGVTATFSETTIDVPPGASNFRDITLSLTVAPGTKPGAYSFSVVAASTTDPAVTGTAAGTLNVTAGGVEVTLDPSSGAPGGSFEAKVTNTGTVSDSFKLTLGGPAALVSSLGTSQVTLAPGASQMVPISTGAVDFAVQGNLNLMAMATSTSDPAIEGAAAADVTIPATTGMTAEFSPASQTLSSPGKVTFLLMVHNTGNTEDSYSATITGVNGPVTATLVGLDGSPTQSIGTFILPGLSTGEIELEADLSAVGQGAITVVVKSLTNSDTASIVAITTLTPAPVVPPPPAPGQGSNSGPTVGPKIAQVQRFGYHMRPTTLVLTFDEALEAATADDTHNYRIIGPHGGKIRVTSAKYNPANLTVTLHTSRRIDVHDRYTLIVNGKAPDGLTNTEGVLLDGDSTGKAAGSDPIPITWRNLAGVTRRLLIKYHFIKNDPRPASHAAQSKSRIGATTSPRPEIDHDAHSVSHRSKLFTRPQAFSSHRPVERDQKRQRQESQEGVRNGA